MTSDAKIAAYIKNNAPDVDYTGEVPNGTGTDITGDDQLKEAIDKLKMITPEQLAYITRNTAEPT